MHPHRHLRPGLRSQRDLPVDPCGLAPSVALRHLPHADQRVSAAAQHQLLQVPDLGPVLLLRRLEDPLPQPPYFLLAGLPVDGMPGGETVLRSVHRHRVHHGVRQHGVQLALRFRRPWPHCLKGSPAHVSSLSGPVPGPVSGRLCGTASRGASRTVPVSRRLTAHRHSLPGHPVPARDLGLRYLRLTGEHQQHSRALTGFPRSACMSCDRGGRPLYPEASGVLTAGEDLRGRRLPFLHGQALHPGLRPISRGSG